MSKFSLPVANMLEHYFHLKEHQFQKHGDPARIEEAPPQGETSQKVAVFLSGGKDSVHLLLKLLEHRPAYGIVAFYVGGLNRSEQHYEKKAVKAVCQKVGVELVCIEPKNSIKLNRDGHNISLREELALVTALPYIVEMGINTCYWGTIDSFRDLDKRFFASSYEALLYITVLLRSVGVHLEHKNTQDVDPEVTSISVFNDMVVKWPEYLDLSSSCYTQINFREKRHELLQDKVQTIQIAKGCGQCIKCCRINAAILKWGDLQDADVNDVGRLKEHLETRLKKLGPDHQLEELLK